MEKTTARDRCSGKKALVTGGASGLGRAIASALAREGADVCIWDVDPSKGEEAAEALRRLGRRALFMEVDVSVGRRVREAARDVLETWGRLDVLVNNAGICPPRPFEAITEAEWDRVMAVNLKSVFLCSQAFLAVMKRRGSGVVINLGSVAGKVGGIVSGAHYSASKAGVMCLTKSLAREGAPHGVRVNAIAPGVIETEMTRGLSGGDWSGYLAAIPLGRIGKAEDVARVAVFLASEEASYITGEIIDVNGGQLMD